MKNRISVVVAYFGVFPKYFPLWLRSCEFNSTVDFFLVTDQKLGNLPSNVKCVKMSLMEMKKRASEVLGFEAALSRPYKCCDYKPIYGLLFKDLLGSYDYWGHCDIDVIFGDLQKFFDEYHLYDYEKFGMLGHLSLFKNTDRVNHAYLIPNNLADYRRVYTTEDNVAFDELCGISTIMMNHGFKVFLKRIFVDIAQMYHRYRMIEEYSLDVRAKNYEYQTFCWNNGKTYHVYMKNGVVCKDEYLYVHFKKRPNFRLGGYHLNCVKY